MKRSSLSHIFAVLLTVALWLSAAPLLADVLDNHSQVSGQSTASPPGEFVSIESNGAADTLPVIDTYSYYHQTYERWFENEARSRGWTSQYSSALLNAAARSYDESGGTGAQASAQWMDILFPTGPIYPESITIEFQMRAALAVNGWASTSSVQVYTGVSPTSFQSISEQKGVMQLWGPSYDNEEPREAFYETVGFDSLEVEENRFVGTFHLDVPFNLDYGGYFWGVGLNVGSSTYRTSLDSGRDSASVTSYFGVGIVGISATGGGALPSLTSDSGLISSPPAAGDFDFDGDIDGYDFLMWQRGESPNPLSAEDLAAWQANYGNLEPGPLSIPEPACLIFTCIVFM